MKLRPQYHLRDSDQGLLAWDVVSLIERTSGLTPTEIALEDIAEIDEPHWFNLEGDTPTSRKIAEHARLIEEADLTFPIILDPEGRVMDGMHRVCKALNTGRKRIWAYRLTTLPEPDFVGVAPQDLPYENNLAEQDAAGNPLPVE